VKGLCEFDLDNEWMTTCVEDCTFCAMVAK
jgi:hypothetical protein